MEAGGSSRGKGKLASGVLQLQNLGKLSEVRRPWRPLNPSCGDFFSLQVGVEDEGSGLGWGLDGGSGSGDLVGSEELLRVSVKGHLWCLGPGGRSAGTGSRDLAGQAEGCWQSPWGSLLFSSPTCLTFSTLIGFLWFEVSLDLSSYSEPALPPSPPFPGCPLQQAAPSKFAH